MSRKIHRGLALGIAAFVLACPAQAAAGGPEDRMLAAISQVRQSHGVAPLRESPTLTRSAERYSRFMLGSGYFGHRARVSAPGNWSRLGENLSLSSGWGARVGPVLGGWLRSPTHRAVLLNPSYSYAGVGAARGRFRGRKATAWTLHVGRPGKRRRMRRI